MRQEADTFYDNLAEGRLANNTNGPRVIMNDVIPAVDRIVAAIVPAYTKRHSAVFRAIRPSDPKHKLAAEQATNMTYFNIMNNGGYHNLRGSVKSVAKYPYGGVIKTYTEPRVVENYDVKRIFTLQEHQVKTLEEAKTAANIFIESKNTNTDYKKWEIHKIKTISKRVPVLNPETGEQIIEEGGEKWDQKELSFEIIFKITIHELRVLSALVPPEEFVINDDATCINDARFVGHIKETTVGEVKEIFPKVKYSELSSSRSQAPSRLHAEKINRRKVHGYYNQTEHERQDAAGRQLHIADIYIHVDADGDGIPELRHIIKVGNKLLVNDVWEGPIPFCLPHLNSDPHRPTEITVVERAKDSTLVKTSVARADTQTHNERNNTQIITRQNAFPATGRRNLIAGKRGIVPYGTTDNPADMSRPLADSVYVIPKPEPSSASTGIITYIDAQRAAQLGYNNLNDTQNASYATKNPATAAIIQKKEQDVYLEDCIREFGETMVKPMYLAHYYLLLKNSTHPYIQEMFLEVTGQPSIDAEMMLEGDLFSRTDVEITVGLGNDDDEYEQQRASMIEQILQSYSQGLQNPATNMVPRFREAAKKKLKSVGEDDWAEWLGSEEEFGQFMQTLIQTQQQQQQQGPDPMQQKMQELQIASLEADVAEKNAKAQKAQAEARKAMAEAAIVEGDAAKAAEYDVKVII